MKRFAYPMLFASFTAASAQTASQPVPAPASATMPQVSAAPDAAALAKQVSDQTVKLNDWAQLGRYAKENAALAADRMADTAGRVVFYGDSITDAWKRNGGKFFPSKPYLIRGISGQTTPQMVVRFRQDVIDLHPVAVVILAGTNDVAGNTGPETDEQIQDNFKSMVDLAHENGIKVVITSILPAAAYPWKAGVLPAQRIKLLNAWLSGYCTLHHIPYVDYYSAMADAQGGMKPGLSLDGVHPNAAGYAIMEPLAQAALNKLLAPR